MLTTPLEPSPRSKRDRWSTVLLALFPIVLAVLFYHPEWLTGGNAYLGPDGAFYIYQIGHGAELHGVWWKLGTDARCGFPYPTGASKNPGLYEGLDLLLLGSLVGQFLTPLAAFQFVATASLVLNGWAASWLTLRFIRSTWAAALASYLTIVNLPTLIRFEEHLHLIKYGWVALSFWAFSRYLDAPTTRRGIWLGAATVGTLLASFHFGFFLVLGLLFWWLGCLLSGTLSRSHVRPTLTAIVTATVLAGLGTFPVWSDKTNTTLAKLYSQRNFTEVWTYSAEPWQYITRPGTKAAEQRLIASGRKTIPHSESLTESALDREIVGLVERYGNAAGGWNYYGATVLICLALFGVFRIRGASFGVERPVILDRMAGLGLFWIVLSLAGGPGALLYELTPQFRCYGRAGLLTLPLAAVLAAVMFHWVMNSLKSTSVKLLLGIVLCGLLVFDWRDTARMRMPAEDPKPPAWVPWLTSQPDDVRLAAFPSTDQSFCWGEGWHWQSLAYSLQHRHRTLNGAEFAFVFGDLQLLGSGYNDLSPAGVQFVASLGYTALALDEFALKRSPWLTQLPWLKRDVDLSDGWSIWRIETMAPKFPIVTRRELLTHGIGPIRTVPAGSVICPRFHLTETLIVADPVPVDAAWIDERGAISGPWMRILEQCVYGPGLGAYTVRTPKQTGSWSLRFRDRATGVVLGEQRFQIADRAALPRSEQLGSSYAVVAPLSQFADGACRIWVKNETAEYLCARPDDDKNPVTHPNLKGVVPGTLICTLRSRMSEPGRENTYEYRRLFLADLAPGEEYEVILPPGTLSTKPQPNRELVGALHSGEVLLPQNPSPQLRLRFDTK